MIELFRDACHARVMAEVSDTYDAIRHLSAAAVYLKLIYYVAPSQVKFHVNSRLQEIMGDGMTVSSYFEHLDRRCDSIQMLDMRARDKQALCNKEYSAALDVLFMIMGEALNNAGVFKITSMEERKQVSR